MPDQIKQWSYSRYSTYAQCPFRLKCKAILKLKEPSPRDLVSIVLSSQDWLDDDENQKIGKKFRDLLMNDKGVKSDTSLLTLAARIAREKDYGVVRKAMITALQ